MLILSARRLLQGALLMTAFTPPPYNLHRAT